MYAYGTTISLLGLNKLYKYPCFIQGNCFAILKDVGYSA